MNIIQTKMVEIVHRAAHDRNGYSGNQLELNNKQLRHSNCTVYSKQPAPHAEHNHETRSHP